MAFYAQRPQGSLRRALFDGYRLDAAYALETLRAAKRGGARTLVLCETNGGGLPWDVQAVVAQVLSELSHPLGIHAHDDSGCGVANSLAAVLGGARHVQGTINGFGERCGNANLSVIVPNLELKLGFRALAHGKLEEVTELSLFVADVANVTHDAHMAYVGRSAFAHKGGTTWPPCTPRTPIRHQPKVGKGMRVG